ncbi:MAG: hypothetical protein AAF358_23980 [Pseudomonadota bacterium]
MKNFRLLLAGLLGTLLSPAILAHDTSLNEDGCHKGKKHDDYHCHAGALEGRKFQNPEQAAQALITEAVRPKDQSTAGQPEPEDRDPS